MTRWKVKAISIVVMITVLTGCGIRTADDNHTEQETSDVSTESSTKPSTEPSTESSTEPSTESGMESSIVQAGGEKAVLTERQKEILKKEGLPTDYYELEGQQQDAITRIELCLDYLDRTYPDDTFTYLSYEGFGFMSGRSPQVYVLSEKIGEDRCVSVGVKKFDGQYKFYDDYKMVMDSNVYQAEIEKYIRSQLPDAEFFVNASIDEYVEGDSYIMERASGYFTIVMNDAFESEDEVKVFLENMAEWLNSHNKTMAKAMLCIVFRPEDYKDVNINNYIEPNNKQKVKYWVRCMINTDQQVHIY